MEQHVAQIRSCLRPDKHAKKMLYLSAAAVSPDFASANSSVIKELLAFKGAKPLQATSPRPKRGSTRPAECDRVQESQATAKQQLEPTVNKTPKPSAVNSEDSALASTSQAPPPQKSPYSNLRAVQLDADQQAVEEQLYEPGASGRLVLSSHGMESMDQESVQAQQLRQDEPASPRTFKRNKSSFRQDSGVRFADRAHSAIR